MLQELRSNVKGLADHFEQEDRADRETLCPEGVEPLATWWQQKTSGTTYVRCTIPARHLPGQSLALRYSDLKIGPDGEVFVPRQRGAMIAQFVGNATRALIMAHLQEQGTKVLMEVDDNYLVPPPDIAASEWQTKIDRSSEDRYSFQAHRKIIRWVDGVIVSTDELAERYSRRTQAPIYVCPNSADLADWPASPEGPGRRERRHIGFAGSASHKYDLALVERALDLAARSGATVHRFGGQPDQWRFPHIAAPWTNDLAEYRRNLEVLDVGLCPLKPGDWQDCKSDLKAIEYTLAGVLPIVSRVPPYKDWFDVVPTCATEKEWTKAIRWALNAPTEELYDAWSRAYEFVTTRKLIEHHIDKWKDAIK